MTPSKKRLEKELDSLRKSPAEGYSVELKDDDLYLWNCSIQGLQNSCYEGGTFHFRIQFTDEYPVEPPTLTFTTRIYHPNIESDRGVVGWKMVGKDWHQNNSVEKVLMSLRALLERPELESAVITAIAQEYENKPNVFHKKAREWTDLYAVKVRDL
jgi:ubiquitin-conjugating enzyme E2 D/E